MRRTARGQNDRNALNFRRISAQALRGLYSDYADLKSIFDLIFSQWSFPRAIQGQMTNRIKSKRLQNPYKINVSVCQIIYELLLKNRYNDYE